MGYAFSSWAGVPLDGLAQQRFDQAEHPRVCDLLFDLSEQQAMIYRVEVGRYSGSYLDWGQKPQCAYQPLASEAVTS